MAGRPSLEEYYAKKHNLPVEDIEIIWKITDPSIDPSKGADGKDYKADDNDPP